MLTRFEFSKQSFVITYLVRFQSVLGLSLGEYEVYSEYQVYNLLYSGNPNLIQGFARSSPAEFPAGETITGDGTKIVDPETDAIMVDRSYKPTSSTTGNFEREEDRSSDSLTLEATGL